MKKYLLFLLISIFFVQPSYAWTHNSVKAEERAVKKVLNSQVKFANKTDFDKFIATYDEKYMNADGFNLEVYSNLVKDIWSSYSNIKYGIKIKNISVTNDTAVAELTETSYAELTASKKYDGELRSVSNSVYNLIKTEDGWKVISDSVLDETTSMMYGEAKNLDIKLTVPEKVSPESEYTATLEFVPPKETLAIASLAVDKVEYPQKPTKEVFRALPDDNILERLFTANNDNVDEYIVASIGLTKTAVDDLSIKLSLTGFGYAIKRVNVIKETGDDESK